MYEYVSFRLQKPKVDLTNMNEISYFNSHRKVVHVPEYDLFFAYTKTFPLFDKRKERCNTQYFPDTRENIFRQVDSSSLLSCLHRKSGNTPLRRTDSGFLLHRQKLIICADEGLIRHRMAGQLRLASLS